MNLILGVDPGLSGALALYDPLTGALDIHDMPTHTVKVSKSLKRRLDLYQLGMLMDSYRSHIRHALIEEVGAMPGQGVSSMFAFGFAAGAVQSVVAANLIPMTLIRPQVWKRSMGLTQSKDDSRRKASMIAPQHCHLWARAKDDGRAEAFLLAWYGAHVLPKTSK